MKNILIGCPVRNREWILPEYLKALENLDYPKEYLAFHFILNDSTDKSKEILLNWKYETMKDGYRYVRITELNFDYPPDWGETRITTNGSSITRFNKGYKALTVLRNLLLDLAWLDIKTDYLFSIDSDIIIKPDILSNLLLTEKHIIAGLIKNDKINHNFIDSSGRRGDILPASKVFEVKITGAIILISRKVIDNKEIRYSPSKIGEDEGFCLSAIAQGIKPYVLSDLQKHITRRSE
jgi:cellulose synthase/poly-beta-1,6-N-acetylglucosamine synthase-like glycosyltransferase